MDALERYAFVFPIWILWIKLRAFFYNQHFYKQRQAEIGKIQAYARQHPEAELLLYENYSHSSYTLSSKNNRTYFKSQTKEQVKWLQLDSNPEPLSS